MGGGAYVRLGLWVGLRRMSERQTAPCTRRRQLGRLRVELEGHSEGDGSPPAPYLIGRGAHALSPATQIFPLSMLAMNLDVGRCTVVVRAEVDGRVLVWLVAGPVLGR